MGIKLSPFVGNLCAQYDCQILIRESTLPALQTIHTLSIIQIIHHKSRYDKTCCILRSSAEGDESSVTMEQQTSSQIPNFVSMTSTRTMTGKILGLAWCAASIGYEYATAPNN
jgi:hypothetical protein